MARGSRQGLIGLFTRRREVQQTIVIGDVPIALTRKRIRHVHLRVHSPDGRVTMSAPHAVKLRMVEAFAAERLEWIRRQQQRLRNAPRESTRRFVDGESHNLWGREHILTVVEREGPPRVTLVGDSLTLSIRPGADETARARAMRNWHKALMHETLPPMIREWEGRLDVRVARLFVRHMKTRWGTCNHRSREIRLNTELVTRPPHLLEYVLVHELVHLIVPNHGPRFTALMDRHYPAWREARAQLNASVFATA